MQVNIVLIFLLNELEKLGTVPNVGVQFLKNFNLHV